MNITLGFKGLTKLVFGKNVNWDYYLIQFLGIRAPLFLMIIKFLLISLSFLSLSPILIVLGLCLTPTKKKKKRERDKIINILENKISNFENKQSSFLEKKVQLFLCHSLIKKNWYKISQFKDAIDLIYLRIYINMALNKVLNDTNLRKLIKSEIFKAPRGTFKEFLRLYNDLKKEFKTLFEVK